jgi:REP element-mobilizing transposase RayT
MPQSLAAVYIHLIFSTKERYLYLRDEKLQTDLHAYLGEISKRLDCPPIRVGGVEDHVHILSRFGRTITQAEWIKELKASLEYLAYNGRWAQPISMAVWLCRFFSECFESRTSKNLHRESKGTP